MEVGSMTRLPGRTAIDAKEAEIIGRKVLVILGKNRLDLTPRNFELIYEVLLGRDQALREAFVAMPKPVSQVALSAVAHQFLPERPLLSTLKSASDAALDALDTFRKGLEDGTIAVAEAEQGANDRLVSLDTQIRQCVEALQAVSQLVTVEPHEVAGQEHLTAQLTFGLPGYAALATRLETLFGAGKPLDGVSLMLCRIEGLDPLSRSGLSKVSDYMKNTLARFTHRLIDKQDTAYWTGPDELSLLVGASSETYLSQLGEKIQRVVSDAEAIARRSIPQMPRLACRFGCARTHRPVLAAQLYGAARQSLQRAELTESAIPLFTEVSGDAATLRRYEALYGRQLR
jgi:diguanylate cyclase